MICHPISSPVNVIDASMSAKPRVAEFVIL
ncbi:hypothetical protein O972_21670 [Mycobacterium avium subsp. avium 10-9275]|nr:hypothetical protein P863_23550 [Mycobacterium avium subsp. silvaticum ATCC 49884]ETB12364.1 hypothetical protein O972_21670 [Mycobacterium avium subsp. avium 10-9275]ETB17851.1 hypothetical protein O973_20670 [Mycobacterium avium subsp. avium 11-4751]ETB25630.1 hypothetical protein O971_21530 [Mycobacterium avium subsp. hominissuis 10-4249]KDO98977.1 hypothetical protein MAVA5_00160 [Mycobacterium avium subsp. hominissuis A5]